MDSRSAKEESCYGSGVDSHLEYADATELLARLERGRIRSLELLERLLERQRRLGPSLNAVVALDEAGARERAAEADAARARGETWGPLHGLPMTIKDSFEVVAGMPTTSGAPAYAQHRPSQHAAAVQALVDAGAIVFGKTNLPTLAGEWQSFNAVYGTSNNPWDPSRTPGGSSGGAASAVAAGLSPVELGSDLGGSIRIPAHFCGVFGHKPTYGLISLKGHVPGAPGSQAEPDLAVPGPIARSARDLRLLFDVLWQGAPRQAHMRPELVDDRRPLEEFSVAVWLHDPLCPLEAEVRDGLEAAIARLEAAGLKVTRFAPGRLDLEAIAQPYLRLLTSLVGAGLPVSARRKLALQMKLVKAGFLFKKPSPVLEGFLDGLLLDHRDWLIANEARARIEAQVAAELGPFDLLLSPVAPWSAFPHAHDGQLPFRTIQVPSGRRPYIEHLPWIALATLCGWPATSVPASCTPSGLPVGLQIIGRRGEDRRCLRFAEVASEALGGFVAPPIEDPRAEPPRTELG